MLNLTTAALVGLFKEEHIETLIHMYSTKELMKVFCQALKFDINQTVIAEKAAFYHDVGKVFFRSLDRLTGKLTSAQYDVIKSHTDYGAKALSECQTLPSEVIEVAKYHHERMDGSGYFGLKGSEIPMLCRMMAIIDVYDAIRGLRSYRHGQTHAEAIEILKEGRTEVDPMLMDIFLRIDYTELDNIIGYYHNPSNIQLKIKDRTVDIYSQILPSRTDALKRA